MVEGEGVTGGQGDRPWRDRDPAPDLQLFRHHPAVLQCGKGVDSTELADFHSLCAESAMTRIMGVGHEEYAQGRLQKFETMDADELAMGVVEEILDAQNYLSMALIHSLSTMNALRERTNEGP